MTVTVLHGLETWLDKVQEVQSTVFVWRSYDLPKQLQVGFRDVDGNAFMLRASEVKARCCRKQRIDTSNYTDHALFCATVMNDQIDKWTPQRELELLTRYMTPEGRAKLQVAVDGQRIIENGKVV